MRKPGGYAYLFDENGVQKEADTFSCGHCGKIVHVKPMADPAAIGGLCYCCNKHVCPVCVAEGRCDPLERKLERWEASDRLYRDMRS
jgi:hypothetical protein